MNKRVDLIRPGYFSVQAAADSRRWEFDFKNETILEHEVSVDFLFVGDSITHFWELNAYFGNKGKYIVNRGISGDTTEFLLKRFKADVIQLKPKYTVLKIGINNTWIMDVFKPDDTCAREVLKDKIINNIGEMVNISKENNQQLILCSILPTDLPAQVNNTMRNKFIISLNKEIKSLAEVNGLIYIDYHSHMVKEDGITMRGDLADDGVHPHVKGYDLMAEVLRKTLAGEGIEL